MKWWEWQFSSVVFLSEAYYPIRIMRKNSKFPIEEHPTKCKISTEKLSKSKAIKNEVWDPCHHQEEPKENLRTKQNVVSWMGSCEQKMGIR